jgi:RNA polymerase sigma-B factor
MVTPARAPNRGRPSHSKFTQRAEYERVLAIRYQRSGDLAARAELVERLIPFASDLARRYRHTDEPMEDLTQVACLGLLKAIDRYEPDRGVKLTSYAAPTILGELKRHIRDKGWALHVPRDVRERTVVVKRESEALSKRLGRSPAPSEVAEAAGCSVGEALEAAEAARSYEAASLDAPASVDAEDGASLLERLGGEDPRFGLVHSRQVISQRWQELPDLERKVVGLRIGQHLTQSEIADRVGCSQMHVSRVLGRALSRLEAA